MKSFQTNFKTYFLGIFSLILIYGCQETSLLNDFSEPEKDLLDFEIKLYNGYLWFKDSSIFEQTLQDVANMTQEDRVVWEKNNGFTSLNTIFETAVDADNAYANILEELSEEELNSKYPNGIPEHADYVLENANLFEFHPEGWFELAIPYHQVCHLLNKEGVVRIADEIKQYTQNAVKIILNGDDTKLHELKAVSKTDETKGIRVNEVTLVRKDIASANQRNVNRYIDESFQVDNCTNKKDRYRVRLYEDIIVQHKGNGNYEFSHGFNVYSFRHTKFGWQRRFKTGSLAGRVDTQTSYGNYSEHISAAGKQHSISWQFYKGVFTEYTKPFIYYSQGEAWGRNGCNCKYPQ